MAAGALSRSLDRLLEDAEASGELRLSGRKLKDFPKANKYHLHDTVFADLSKNRFGDVPEEVTTFLFLERLLLYHNAIRSVPDNIGSLQWLSYLDLSRNQLSEVPRELCLLPLQVLLLSNNKLTSLPKEIGKMSSLAELDASGNQLSQLPITIGELENLRSLNLKSNQLGLLPLQITRLKLEMLNISCNCISSLPIELREMTSLVVLNLEHNPLVFPPATVCIRGRIHIFKYLENQANKDSIQKRADDTRRSTKQTHPHMTYLNHTQLPGGILVDGIRHKTRYTVDSGYSTSDGGEKRWSSDGIAIEEINNLTVSGQGSGRSTPSTPSTISPGPAHLSRAQSLSAETPPITPTQTYVYPDIPNVTTNGDDKSKLNGTPQTYKQYKEALRQQRQQDVYRPRGEQISPPSVTPTSINQSYSTPHSPVANGYHNKSIVSSNPSLSTLNNQNSPTNTMSSIHSTPKRLTPNSTSHINSSNIQPETPTPTSNNLIKQDESLANKRPVQKVVPSRSINKNYSPTTNIPVSNTNHVLSPILNGNSGIDQNSHRPHSSSDGNKYNTISSQDGAYIKPVSPIKGSSSYMSHNYVPTSKSNSLGRNYKTSPTDANSSDQLLNNGSPKLLTTSVGYVNSGPTAGNQTKISWNKDIPPEKFSFTMKREFDRAKEELELIEQLRNIIENRLKMTLPHELAPVLADGVVLCHLANHVRPRAVASVHVPSATQPKLTMARCRRNVDNFLEACRKIGVEEEAVCRPQDILPQEQDSSDDTFERMAAIYKTVTALLLHRTTVAHATDNHGIISVQEYDDDASSFPDSIKISHEFENEFLDSNFENVTQNSNTFIDDNENCFSEHKYSNQNNKNLNEQNKNVHRSRYAEDRCISNFNTFLNDSEENVLLEYHSEAFVANQLDDINLQNNNELTLDNNKSCHRINKYSIASSYNKINSSSNLYNNEYNRINYIVPFLNGKNNLNQETVRRNDSEVLLGSTISEKINYFNGKRTNMNLDIKNNLNTIQNEGMINIQNNKRYDEIVSKLCLATFFATLILLYLFPLPN